MPKRVAVDLTDDEFQVFQDAAAVTGYPQHTAFIRFLIKRIQRDIAAELGGYRLCYKRDKEIELIAPLTPGPTDGSTT